MPIYVGYSQKRRTVRLLSAGRPQVLLCPPPDIDLLATLSDLTNTRNHTYYWEQIRGTPVVLASTDTLATSFPAGDAVDKRFRFWLDYGTAKAQYKDVDIFYTPTSVHQPQALHHEQHYETYTIPNKVETPGYLLPQATGAFNPDVETIPATIITFDEQQLLAQRQGLIKMEVLTDAGYVVDPEDLYTVYNADDIPFTEGIGLPNGVYKFRFYYNFNGINPVVLTSPLMVLNSVLDPDGARGIDDVANINQGSNPTLSPIIRFTIERKVVSHNHSIYTGKEAVLTQRQILTPRRIDDVNFPDLLDTYSLHIANNTELLTLTRLDPSNIGSG